MTDIVLEITYPLEKPEESKIRTNARPEAIEEILSTWIARQQGEGKDDRRANELAEYVIVIELDLSDDSFVTRSNTGNKGLTAGIVVDVFNRRKSIFVSVFS